MKKNLNKVVKGLNYVLTTGEPVFVNGFTERTSNLLGFDGQPKVDQSASVTRGVVTNEGIKYIRDYFPLEELETPHAQIRRNLELQMYQREVQTELTKGIFDSKNSDLQKALSQLKPVVDEG